MTTFTFSHKVHCYQSQMDGEKVKNFPPQGLFSLLPLLPAFRRLRRPQTSPCRVKNSSKPSSRGLELRTPPSWEEKLVAQDGDGPGDLVHNDVDWRQSNSLIFPYDIIIAYSQSQINLSTINHSLFELILRNQHHHCASMVNSESPVGGSNLKTNQCG